MIGELRRFHRFIANHPVGSRGRCGAWQRWLRWQIGVRLLDAPVVMQWLDGACLVVERGMTGATGNLYCGLHEFADMALVLHYFGGGTGRFVDVGANIGSYTVLAAKVCGVATIAVEPVPSSFERLKRNIAVNGISALVEAHQAAAGAGTGEILFSCDRDTMNQVVDESYPGKTLTAPVRPLDELLEGFERQVLEGAARSLESASLEIVLLEGDDDAIRATMENAGFCLRSYDPFAREFLQPLSSDGNGNHVWVRESKLVGLMERLKAAPRRNIQGVEF